MARLFLEDVLSCDSYQQMIHVRTVPQSDARRKHQNVIDQSWRAHRLALSILLIPTNASYETNAGHRWSLLRDQATYTQWRSFDAHLIEQSSGHGIFRLVESVNTAKISPAYGNEASKEAIGVITERRSVKPTYLTSKMYSLTNAMERADSN
jgi:hypothetical protein